MSLPSVFAFCLTYGRPQSVSRILEQWEAMEYEGPRQLVIVDDGRQYREQPAGETWEIISLKRRIASLGEKANFVCSLSRPEHDLLVVIEDDDYLAPWTLNAHADAFKRNPISIPKYFFTHLDDGSLQLQVNKKRNNAHAGWAFSRDVFRRVKGYSWSDILHDHYLWLKFFERGFRVADPTENYPPFLVSRPQTASDQHLSRMEGALDPWPAVERELEAIKDLPTAEGMPLFEALIRSYFDVREASDVLLRMAWQLFRSTK